MKYWEIIADNLKKAGWNCGCISSTDHEGRQFWVVAAERSDAGRFIVQADQELPAFLSKAGWSWGCVSAVDSKGDEKLSTFLDCSDQGYVGTLVLIHVIENATLIVIYTVVIIAQRLGKGDSPRSREFVALPGIYFVSGSP